MGRQRTVYIAETSLQAQRFRNVLAEYGIASTVLDDSSLNGQPAAIAGSPRVSVDELDYEFAYEIATEFDGEHDVDAQEPVGPDDDEWSPWPVCPGCGNRRIAICPACGNRETHLALAESLSPDDLERSVPLTGHEWRDQDGDPILLLCPICDAPFAVQFERCCGNCTHRFADGIQPRPAVEPVEWLSGGRLLAIGLIAILLYALWTYLLSPLTGVN